MSLNFIYLKLNFLIFRMTSRLSIEENADSDNFLKECIQDPTLRDKLSILSRTFQNRRRVSRMIS